MSDWKSRDTQGTAIAALSLILIFLSLAFSQCSKAAEVITIKFDLSPSVQSAMVACQKMASASLGTPQMRERPWECMTGGAMAAPAVEQPNGDLAIEHACHVATREPVDLNDVAALAAIGHEVWYHCLRGLRHE